MKPTSSIVTPSQSYRAERASYLYTLLENPTACGVGFSKPAALANLP